MIEERFAETDERAHYRPTAPPPPPTTSTPIAVWRERYSGGSPEAEREEFEALARDDHGRPDDYAQRGSAATVCRTRSSAPSTPRRPWPCDDAELRFHDDLPPDLRAGFAQPGAAIPDDGAFLQRLRQRRSPTSRRTCAAWRCGSHVDDATTHDLLPPTSRSRTPATPVSSSSSPKPPPAVPASARSCAVNGHVRAIRERCAWCATSRTARKQPGEQCRNRDLLEPRRADAGAPTLAVRYLLRPAADTPPGPEPSTTDPDYLSTEAASRLAAATMFVSSCASSAIVNEKVDADRGHGGASGPRRPRPPNPSRP